MTAQAWQCPTCKEKLDPQFGECWNCGYVRRFDPIETLPEPTAGTNPLVCIRCNVELEYVGTKKLHEGSRAAPFLLGEIGELFIKRERFDVYVCPRCGRVELFVDGIGEEFRDH